MSVVLGLLGTAMPAFAEPPSGPAFIEQWRAVPGIHFPGRARVASADVDGDSRPDFVFVASSNYYAGNHGLIVAGVMPQGIGIKQALILPEDVNVSIPRVLAATVDGVIHIYTVSDQGTVRDFAGWPLSQVTQYSVAAAVSAAAIGDALGTGEICLVVAASDGIHAYNAATGVPLWNYLTQETSDIALAQLDADAPLEVVASTGLVIDGATQATDWQYIEAFGAPLATGHLLGDETTQFVAAQNSAFAVYRGTPWSPLWSAGDSYAGIQSLIAANLDDNDRDVIIEGDTQQSGNVNAYDSTTHQLRFSISGAGSGAGIEALAAADIDGDGVAELAIALSQPSSFGSASTFTIIDTSSGETEWSYAPLPGTFSQVAIGDVDGDGADELVVAGTNEYYYAPVSIFDAATGVLKWQSPAPPGNANDPFYISTSRILLLPHESSVGMDIALAGTSTYSGRITVIDGASHVVKLQIGFYASGPMASRYLVDALALDYDGDGTADYVAATSPAAGGVNGALLQVFSGMDGHTLWTSVPMSSSGSGFINGVLATGPSTDASSELIAVLPASLRAYNMQTQLLDWSLLVAADGAVYLPHGVAGPEIAVFLQTGAVTFYDAVTRAYLRGFTIDAPLTAMFAPDGNSDVLIAASNGRLVWVDGHNGSVIATSDFLGNNLGLGNRLAAVDASPGAWNVASGTDLAIFRHRLELSDRVFATGFENTDQ